MVWTGYTKKSRGAPQGVLYKDKNRRSFQLAVEQQRPRVAAMTVRQKTSNDTAPKPIIKLEEEEIDEILTFALARKAGLRMFVRKTYEKVHGKELEPAQIMFKSDPDNPSLTRVSNIRVGLETLSFCIGAIEYRVTGAEQTGRLNEWLMRGCRGLISQHYYGNPDPRVLFSAYTKHTLH